ncbi:MAG: amino acid adenylation domain-containing protein, partial [Acidobacteria bacterium]|nr:amino acid adenylation domain-containing protein [Acidobacteriota bacterium]
LDAHAHQDLPFEKLVEELRPERALSHSPLFQVMFVLQRQEEEAFALPGVHAARLPLAGETSRFDLTLGAAAGERGVTLAVELNRDLFDAATAVRMLAGLAALLEQLPDAAGRRAGELALLGAGERHQLLAEWNDTGAAGGGAAADSTLHQLFALQALRTAEAVALLAAGEHHLTYGELSRRVDRLAARLAALGVGPEVRAALCVERSFDMLLGLLAILAAGGAYVPLDPTSPAERLRFMVEDCGAAVLVTDEASLGRLEGTAAKVVCLDRRQEALAAAASAAVVPAVRRPATPENLAYVIYTSGSTGRPKGVMVPHRAVTAHARTCGRRFGIGPGDRILQFASIAFDASAEEIFPTLLGGATLVLRDEETIGSAAGFAAAAGRLGLTVLNLPTAFWHELAQVPDLDFGPGLRLVVVGGEAARADRLAAWFGSAAGATTLLNSYGPTETTITATVSELRAAAPARRDTQQPPIGAPLDHVRAYLLDGAGRLAPLGVHAELHIGGAGVARGYLGRPELTAERFIPDAFSGRPGERLYRSGDLVRRLPDGTLDYLGRIDHQVKLRGFRIELGEIEAALAAHPRVGEAVVLAREDAPGRRRLVAYVTPAEGVGDAGGAGATGEPLPGPATFAAYLRERLPDYMVPEAYVPLAALPLTPSAKVDRRALPAPRERRAGDPTHLPGTWADGGAAFVPPRTPLEELVAGIWSEVLGIEPIGIHDRFFDLGGHSLLATQLAARVRRTCGVEVALRTLFEAPTLAAFTASLAAAGEGRAVPPIARAPRDGPLPASFAQERLWFLDQLEGGGSSYNVPLALQLAGRLEPAALAAAWRAVARRHEALRTGFAAAALHQAPASEAAPPEPAGPPGPAGGEAGQAAAPVVQVVAAEIETCLPMVDLLPLGARAAAEGRRLALAAALRPFDLRRPPLARAMLLRVPVPLSAARHPRYPQQARQAQQAPPVTAGEPLHLLVVCLHHIVCDGWSLDVLLRELSELYGAAVAGRAAALPPLA